MDESLYDFDVQSSPKCLELFGGWDELRKLANSMVEDNPNLVFYPQRWFMPKTPEDRADCPERIEITHFVKDGVVVKVLPYVDDKGIRVISFDPNRELHEIKDGQHRGKLP